MRNRIGSVEFGLKDYKAQSYKFPKLKTQNLLKGSILELWLYSYICISELFWELRAIIGYLG